MEGREGGREEGRWKKNLFFLTALLTYKPKDKITP
jgi:hypothetical protein